MTYGKSINQFRKLTAQNLNIVIVDQSLNSIPVSFHTGSQLLNTPKIIIWRLFIIMMDLNGSADYHNLIIKW